MGRLILHARWLVAALVALAFLPAAANASSANTAALQVALKALHLYHGGIDGIAGPGTKRAVRAFQRRHKLSVDGVAGPHTRRALGRRGRPPLGSRTMTVGDRGWDVAALQFLLRKRGFSPGTIDGGYGSFTASTVRRYQAAVGLTVDGKAGRGTISALRRGARRQTSSGSGSSGTPSGPIRLLHPLHAIEGDGFGYPGGRRHDGIDYPAPYGTAVGAAGVGTVISAGWNSGGYGNLVIVQHRLGYQTYYAHLSRFAVSSGSHVAGGVRIGYVGATGHATGPHLHFELRHNGVPINPEPYFIARWSLGKLAAGPFPATPSVCSGGDRVGAC
jgi:murein DD-endopeptidase MepM/ murein hydrolase activator NlpD